MKTIEVSSLVLAYLGDSVYENYIRLFLIQKGINHVKKLQEESLNYVSAKSQARIIHKLINDDFFNQKELEIIKRARNSKTNSHPKNTDIITYKEATSLEAIIGYLKLENNIERIEELMNKIINS